MELFLKALQPVHMLWERVEEKAFVICFSDKDIYLCSMLRIVTHIEQLLLMHDCIIIPKLGGFVLQNLPARYRADEHTFFPTRKEVVFNTTLQHDDGLLSESYMQMYGADYRKARLMWEEDVEELKSILQQEKKLSFGRVGSFETGEEGQLIFHPGDAHIFSIESYGLPAFELPSLAQLASAVKEREEDEWLVGKKKSQPMFTRFSGWNFFRAAAATAAAVALFLVISTPVKEVDQAAYTASFVPTEMVAYKVAAPGVSPVLPEASAGAAASFGANRSLSAAGSPPMSSSDKREGEEKKEKSRVADAEISIPPPANTTFSGTEKTHSDTSETPLHAAPPSVSRQASGAGTTVHTEKPTHSGETEKYVSRTTPTKPAVQPASPAVKTSRPADVPAASKKMYHIVIASFPSETQANEYIARIDKSECKHVSKVVRDGRYRIYADKFDNREDAENYMATLRKNPKYKDAWLFISR